MGVAPVEAVGKGLQMAARGGTQYAVKKYVSKGTLKAIQDFGKRIGIKILQKSILKYTVPVVSALAGVVITTLQPNPLVELPKIISKIGGKLPKNYANLYRVKIPMTSRSQQRQCILLR